MLVFFRVSIGVYAVAYHFHSLYVSKIGFGVFDRKSANDGNNRNKEDQYIARQEWSQPVHEISPYTEGETTSSH